MKLSAPKVVTWWIAILLGILGILGKVVSIPVLSALAFWLVVIGLVLLALATVVKGL